MYDADDQVRGRGKCYKHVLPTVKTDRQTDKHNPGYKTEHKKSLSFLLSIRVQSNRNAGGGRGRTDIYMYSRDRTLRGGKHARQQDRRYSLQSRSEGN